MPQIVLPLFPSQSTPITRELAFERCDGLVCYSNGMLPVFQHPAEDVATFRFYTSSLIGMGAVTPGEIVAAFGVPLITVRRYYKLWREQGAKGFYAPRPARRGHRLTPELLLEAQVMLDSGKSGPEVARDLHILPNTLNKAVQAGRLKKRPPPWQMPRPPLLQ